MRSVPALWQAALACMMVVTGPAWASSPDYCASWRNPDLTARLMRHHDQLLNRDDQSQPLIPAFAEAVPLIEAHRWRDGLSLLWQAARSQPPPGSNETQREAIYGVGEDARLLVERIRDCPTWLPPDQSRSAEPVSVPWNALPKLPSATANVIRP